MPKAIALQRGYYPVAPGGGNDIVEEGQTFELVEPFVKAKWFKVLEEPKAKGGGKKPEGDTLV